MYVGFIVWLDWSVCTRSVGVCVRARVCRTCMFPSGCGCGGQALSLSAHSYLVPSTTLITIDFNYYIVINILTKIFNVY